ncbi:cbb3-type cytochrome oxidase assembly protein CcoS [Pedobacter metabolipauper]|uniref:Cbb3-type cytochrome oxidase maturation protein n=1 Tax=Pedobacter metabolipauper TaxID=425513 RepID=A0A4R6T1X9_9SPHI|nr:cbb3-type cytochrome oxidase assembly protein CcoS [Pedobacter metabolipauper]TDQ11321.1 cbb3-type cytochrome oxidase maturation protein [Pedobacter metabolipauper]
MNMIYFLIGCSILLALIFLAAFFWASRTGQHDDTYTPAVRILFDDETTGTDPEQKSDEDHV